MISIIAAVAANGVIGDNNQLIWHIGDDLRRFKQLTTGNVVVMGRKTFDSIGRALPNRMNIVVSRQASLEIEAQARVALPDAEIFIIGGGEIYRQAMPLAQQLYITHVEQSPSGDTLFPDINPAQWLVTHSQQHDGFMFCNYLRREC
jgi:dihydrofolate reductase